MCLCVRVDTRVTGHVDVCWLCPVSSGSAPVTVMAAVDTRSCEVELGRPRGDPHLWEAGGAPGALRPACSWKQG